MKNKFLARKFNYPLWMVTRFSELLGDELVNFLEANEKPLQKTIRVNTLKIQVEKLVEIMKRKSFQIKPLKWLKEGLIIAGGKFPLGATKEYLLGYYFIQTSASMLPPIVLEPKSDEIIVDMCAAPGGKSTHISQLMKNKGLLISIEVNSKRVKSLKYNLSRCSVRNAIILHMDANDFKPSGFKVDKILLDAPCTGEGLIKVIPERKFSRTIDDIHYCSVNQKKLLSNAIKILKKGGVLVYSTCSLAPEENEEVIDYILKKFNVEVSPITKIIGEPGVTSFKGKKFDDSIKYAKRLYPHKHNSIGFFICKLVKKENNECFN
ncbi:MAG: NOL1/NOP2/sun family putative RNA methylase [Candidatus Odinarchaeia archaeon]